MTLFGRYFWTSNYVNEQPKKFPTCHVRNISIYAPTRGATTSGAVLCLLNRYFNPRSYKRSDLDHPKFSFFILHFNPRSYKRSDAFPAALKSNVEKFQSTLLQEERLGNTQMLFRRINFNPRSYKRSDRMRKWNDTEMSDFNPRSYKRSDLYVCYSLK